MKDFNYKRYWKKYFIKLTMKLFDLTILLGIGSALGFQLIRY